MVPKILNFHFLNSSVIQFGLMGMQQTEKAPIKAIILDLDGTIIPHDEAYKRACVESVMQCSSWLPWKLGVRKFNPSDLTGTLKNVFKCGLHNGKIYKKEEKGLSDLFNRARYKMSLNYIRPDPALIEALSLARDSGIKLFVHTHSEMDIAMKALKKAGVRELIGENQIRATRVSKKDHNTHHDFMRMFLPRVPAHQVAFFDDDKDNLRAAKKIGMRVCHISADNNIPLSQLITNVIRYNKQFGAQAPDEADAMQPA